MIGALDLYESIELDHILDNPKRCITSVCITSKLTCVTDVLFHALCMFYDRDRLERSTASSLS